MMNKADRIAFLVALLAGFSSIMLSPKPIDKPASAQQLYDQHCASCHQATGDGVPFLQPALWESERANGPKGAVAEMILWGSAIVPPGTSDYENEMPGFAGLLSNEEVASLASFIRTQFDNNGGAVSAELVRERRKSPPKKD